MKDAETAMGMKGAKKKRRKGRRRGKRGIQRDREGGSTETGCTRTRRLQIERGSENTANQNWKEQ